MLFPTKSIIKNTFTSKLQTPIKEQFSNPLNMKKKLIAAASPRENYRSKYKQTFLITQNVHHRELTLKELCN